MVLITIQVFWDIALVRLLVVVSNVAFRYIQWVSSPRAHFVNYVYDSKSAA